ncbi:uncharacterized protein [Gossypium hirsutum]|uniref:Uncharacterized protein n=1 Tax=Gossypium hirsutum TaxID=3635 RepID=A0A1U8PW50_GOSHI|nr:uncharacterized protein LOC107963339 [Gossypium hirsutum]
MAEYSFEARERIMNDIDCTPKEKLKGAISLLRNEKYVGESYVDAQRREFMNLTQGDRIMVEYEFESSDSSTEGVRVCRLVDKAKITKEVKRVERQNNNRERGKNKRHSEPSSFVQIPKKWARPNGPSRVGVSVAPTVAQLCSDCARRHQGKCQRRLRPQRAVQQLPRGCGSAKSGNGMSRGQRAPSRGVNQTEVRYVPDVITDTFLVYDIPYVTLIDIGSTHSYIDSFVSDNLGIPVESISGEISVLSPLGQFVRVNRLYMNVLLEVQGVVFPANLIELRFGEFDLILASMDSSVKNIRIVREFLNIFPKELLGLPPNQKVKFGIDLLPGIAPVSIAPYHMAIKELIELKAQL